MKLTVNDLRQIAYFNRAVKNYLKILKINETFDRK